MEARLHPGWPTHADTDNLRPATLTAPPAHDATTDIVATFKPQQVSPQYRDQQQVPLERFRVWCHDRFIDLGAAVQHALTMGGHLAHYVQHCLDQALPSRSRTAEPFWRPAWLSFAGFYALLRPVEIVNLAVEDVALPPESAQEPVNLVVRDPKNRAHLGWCQFRAVENQASPLRAGDLMGGIQPPVTKLPAIWDEERQCYTVGGRSMPPGFKPSTVTKFNHVRAKVQCMCRHGNSQCSVVCHSLGLTLTADGKLLCARCHTCQENGSLLCTCSCAGCSSMLVDADC
jgi:hypothetical protein